jgi:hypothetical protein
MKTILLHVPGRASAANESLIDSYSSTFVRSYIPTFLRSIDFLEPLFIDVFLQGQEVVIFIVCSLLRLRGYQYGRERTVQ